MFAGEANGKGRRMATLVGELSRRSPLDLVERIATHRDWRYDRSGDEDISVHVVGRWCDYQMFVSSHLDQAALLFAFAFDMKVPGGMSASVHPLLAIINQRLLVGHFDLWSADGQPVFRHALLLRGASAVSLEQVEDIVEIAVAECERYYPAFQLVIWGGKKPEEAIAAAMFETVGEA